MADDELLLVAANKRYLRGALALSGVMSAVAFVLAPGATPAQRVGLYVSGLGIAGAFVLALLRLRMAKFPQLVADDAGFTVVTLFTRRSFKWTELEAVDQTFFASPLGKRRFRKPKRSDAIFGEVPKQFLFRARGCRYAVMSPPRGGDDLDDIRERFISVWHEHAPPA